MTTGDGSGNANGGAGSPWARPATGSEPPVTWVRPNAPAGAPHPGYHRRPAPDVIGTPDAPAKPSVAKWVIGGGAVLVLGLVVVLVLASAGVFRSDNPSLFGPFAGEDPEVSKPPLAQLCPPASENPPPGGKEPAPVAGPRIPDRDAGISYLRLGDPWKLWDRGPWGQGTLGVDFNTGYYFVTETYSGGDYLASVLSGKVPATVGDSLSLNLPCAGRQVAEDVRRAYYPQPNVKEQARDEQIVVGGRPAWVSTFHLTFEANGLDARGEQVAVVLVDVGRPDAAVLYISIPDTHRQYNPEIDRVIASIQPA
ncbi:hypothetical protein [Cryptosporangium arvum]|uniref:hypothetical protein n=1 Tax=Cryptosporangium arvum TaxID=80871 RepID=UPI0006880EF2|nr:hypothetical protein [Cryptosporangium arvum]